MSTWRESVHCILILYSIILSLFSGTVSTWTESTHQKEDTVHQNSEVCMLEWSPDGTRLISADKVNASYCNFFLLKFARENFLT